METERGLDRQDIMPLCLMLGEEVGELFRAIEARNETRTWRTRD